MENEFGEVEENDINEMSNDAISAKVKCLDIGAPIKIVLRKEWQKKLWFNEDIQKQMQQRDMTYKAACRNKSYDLEKL